MGHMSQKGIAQGALPASEGADESISENKGV